MTNSQAADAIAPFQCAVDETDLQDLRERLARTRWPDAETVEDWSQGIPLAYVRELADTWAGDYDWRRVEAQLNAYEQFTTPIDGVDVHFLHVRSSREDALGLVMTHGWPGGVLEFLDVLGPLTDPAAHGGGAADAFHVVCPSLPGYGFSGKPTTSGWRLERIADAWAELMARLGYDRYGAQGGDWGAMVTTHLAQRHPEPLAGVHLNMGIADPAALLALGDLTDEEQDMLAGIQNYIDWENGYAQQQATRPQTVSYALTDSPAGQLAWIVEKYYAWTDNHGSPEDAVPRERLLDIVSLYWLTRTAASSARLYWESFKDAVGAFPPIEGVPVGYTVFPHEIFRLTERWARTRYPDLRYYHQVDVGGHFAALEQPQVFVEEVRAAFRAMR
jgi:epoxide hydrolase